jgi:peptidoglycan hydrolase-like protein with peptidoglycan-binding domain
MRRVVVMVSLLATIVLPPAARAQTPGAPATSVPAPVQTTMALELQHVGGARATALVGTRLRVRGVTAAFVPGQIVTVRFSIAGRRRAVRQVALRPRADGTGGFIVAYRPRRPGTMSVRATHDATPELGAIVVKAKRTDIIPRSVRPRSGKASIRALQRRLRRLGYVTGERGVFDGRTARAVLAFRKVTGMKRTTRASVGVMRALAKGKGGFAVKFPDHGRHIEADLSRQVIALISNGRVERIYPVSSGAPSTPTVRGAFRVYAKTPGTNAKGMVDSAYFSGAYATHGYPSVPAFPASHGCLRVPIPDARSLFRWIHVGTRVDVYVQ